MVTRNADAVSCVRAIEGSAYGNGSTEYTKDCVGANERVSLWVAQCEQQRKRAVVTTAIPSG